MGNHALSGEAYPLYWPEGWPRTPHRRSAPYEVSFLKARDGDSLPLANYAEPLDAYEQAKRECVE
jgi:hypothetical protein